MRRACVPTQRQVVIILMMASIVWLQGCAGTPKAVDRSTLEKPAFEPEQIPWDWSLKLEDGQWDLDYVERGDGNIAFQSIYKSDEYPEESIDAVEITNRDNLHNYFLVSDIEGDIKGKLLYVGRVDDDAPLLWLPRTGSDFPYAKLPKYTRGEPSWNEFLTSTVIFPPFLIAYPFIDYPQFSTVGNYAAVIKQAKNNEAGSVKKYDQRLKDAVERYNSIKSNISSYNERQNDKDDDSSDQVSQVWNRHRESLSERVHERLEFVINDQTGYDLVDHLDGFDPRSLIVTDVEFNKRDMMQTDYPDNDRLRMTTPTAETLDGLDKPLDQLANELERARQKANKRDEAFQKRIEAFKQSLNHDAFSIRIKTNEDAANRFFDRVSISTPQVTTSKDRVTMSGPVEITVNKINLDTGLGRLVSVIPEEAAVTAKPRDNATVEKRVSGEDIGYTLALDDRPHSGWRRLFDRDNDFVGWVRADNVGSPDEARQAQAMRVLKDSRPDGTPTAEAIQLLLEAQQSRANEAMPDFGDLVGDMSYQSLRVITCDQAVGEAGYWCDVKGQIDTNNAGVARLQQLANAFAGRGMSGGSGVVPFNAQVRVVKNRQGRWELMATKSNNP